MEWCWWETAEIWVISRCQRATRTVSRRIPSPSPPSLTAWPPLSCQTRNPVSEHKKQDRALCELFNQKKHQEHGEFSFTCQIHTGITENLRLDWLWGHSLFCFSALCQKWASKMSQRLAAHLLLTCRAFWGRAAARLRWLWTARRRWRPSRSGSSSSLRQRPQRPWRSARTPEVTDQKEPQILSERNDWLQLVSHIFFQAKNYK